MPTSWAQRINILKSSASARIKPKAWTGVLGTLFFFLHGSTNQVLVHLSNKQWLRQQKLEARLIISLMVFHMFNMMREAHHITKWLYFTSLVV